jgi:alkylhydroperoxidase family enzyme
VTTPGDARIPMLGVDAALAAGEAAGVHEALAGLNVFRTLLHRPRVAKGVADLLLSLLFGAELDDRLRELVIMRIGWSTGSEYEWAQHWKVALDLGVDETDILSVRDWPASECFDELDRAVLSATDQALAGARIDEPTMDTLRSRLSDDAVIDLVSAIGTWTMISTLLRSLDVPLEDGMQSWPPEGEAP